MTLLAFIRLTILLSLLPVFGGGASTSVQPKDPPGLFAFLQGRRVYQPQLVSPDGSALILVWRETEEKQSNLYVARSNAGGRFSDPQPINTPATAPGRLDMDEARAALATGDEGHFAVAWSASGGSLFTAVSQDGGRTFGEPIRLNQDTTKAYRGFPAIAFDASNVLHAIWIDGREAPPRAEEPADLYLAIVRPAGVREINLTDRQEASICGCCKPSLEREGDSLVATFRNTGGGYRDIFQITIGADGDHGDAVPLAAPMWKIEGCPMAGPINPGRSQALWMEASLGRWRVLAARPGEDFGVVLEEDDTWSPERPPRSLSPAGEAADLLVPGEPYSRRLHWVGGEWQPTGEELPVWATSGVAIQGKLLLVGAQKGEFRFEERTLN